MILEIFDKQKGKEKIIGIYMNKTGSEDDGDITLTAIDRSTGRSSVIVSVNQDGTLKRFRNIKKDFGFKLDDLDRIKLDDEE